MTTVSNSLFFCKYYSGNQIKDDTGGVGSTHGGDAKSRQKF
jgi:hypothetical protein